ncbi:MAG: tetratricopeptide repeat protein [Candidatus Sumerlaeota bacterium]|nr:tetratricopeptide repeat protein [Candidatus Sumerlaeota bacterium]
MKALRFRRRQPLLILCAFGAAGGLYLLLSGGGASGLFGNSGAAGHGDPASEIKELEKTIALGAAPVEVWTRYGECLATLKRYDQAARAYEMALKLEPINRRLQLQRGVALALNSDVEGFYQFVAEVAINDPRLTVDMIRREECKPLLKDPRIDKVYREALAQYVD